MRLFCIFGEQVELSNPEFFFRAYSDITRDSRYKDLYYPNRAKYIENINNLL